MYRPGFVGLLVIVSLCIASGAGGPVSAGVSGDTPAGAIDSTSRATASSTPALAVGSQDFNQTLFIVTVYENGSATWTFRYEQTLDGADDIEAFETFAEEFESEETGLYDRFTHQANGLTDRGVERTEREMAATNFNRSATVEHGIGDTGVVEMSFLWEGFAQVEEDDTTVVVGDALDGFPLESNQQLIVETQGDLVFVSAHPPGSYATQSLEDADSITWVGDQEFIAGQPRVVLEHEDEQPPWPHSLVDPSMLGVAALFLLSLALAGAFAWRRAEKRRGRRSTHTVTEGAVGASDGVGASGGDGVDSTDDESLAADDLLTDEDRVVKLIRENGGRMKQVHIVEETGWSKSKVSMLLSEMEAEDTISKLRVGRENIISLDGFEPEATKSPFEE